MALYVNTNVSSLNAQRQLMNSGNSLDTSFQRLSSGLRINSAADDAAGRQWGRVYGCWKPNSPHCNIRLESPV